MNSALHHSTLPDSAQRLHNPVAAALLSLVIFLAAGCVDSDRSASVENASTSSTPKRHGVNLPKFNLVSSEDARPKPSINSVVIGIDADFSHNSSKGGQAILRGVELAAEQINAAGGLLGRKIEIVTKDHHGNPRRGIDNLLELAALPNTLCVVGGVHTPVAIEELPVLHQHQLIYLCPWAAGTPIVSNGYSPNFVFRVSVRDQYAGEFLVSSAIETGHRRIGMLLEKTGWGKSNEKAVHNALAERGLAPTCTVWFDWNQHSMASQIDLLCKAGTDAVILVANAPEGALAVNQMAALPIDRRIPMFSHWGILGGEFQAITQNSLDKVDLRFLQTFSFANETSQTAKWLGGKYCQRYGVASVEKIPAPFGTAHAYDLVQLLAQAVQHCNSLERSKVRDALEQVKFLEGAVRTYAPPFTPGDHDALGIEDFQLMRFTKAGKTIPAEAPERTSSVE